MDNKNQGEISRSWKNPASLTADTFSETRGSLKSVARLGFSSTEALLHEIEGKKVLELGSGSGVFAREVYLASPTTTVVSMNPRLGRELFKAKHESDEAEWIETASQQRSAKDIKKANENYKNTAVAGEWQAPPFAPNTFDYVFSAKGFLYYSNTYDETALRSVLELLNDQGEFRAETMFSTPEELVQVESVAKQMGCEVEFHEQYVIIRKK